MEKRIAVCYVDCEFYEGCYIVNALHQFNKDWNVEARIHSICSKYELKTEEIKK